ncbi:MAG: biotin-dependent carboxyltransferase family protein [Verrucomicrobia bacterium]|nr:biotin-dependent carboxyltransferase family protein [Verrucomicrobiota bacterium]
MAITVNRAGMLTTVQDLGRRGHRAAGVPLGGAMDPLALRLANLLVGNAEDAAGLEFTLRGPELTFASETTIAVGGADFGGVPRWQPVRVRAGERVTFGTARTGCRGYLAIAGALDVPVVLGGRGTYLCAAIGGLEGRALRDGDVLRAAEQVRRVLGRWHIDERILPAYSGAPTVRVVRGAQAEEFGATLTEAEFKVTPKSDRMGVRLAGPGVARRVATELTSMTVAPGTIQVPPDGQPIVLMADAQTIGGYPQIAHVVTVDLPLIAQLQPGDTVRFREVTVEEAHELVLSRERKMGMLREGLAEKVVGEPPLLP